MVPVENEPPHDGVVRTTAAQLFQGGAKRPIRSLAGIEVDLVVRMVEVEGDLEVEGDVPDDALLVVKGGAVCIEGFVAGPIVADKGIRVRGNVAGSFLIARQGDITIEGAILSNAQVIAQSGHLVMQAAESPRCLFGWQGIRIAETMRGGRAMGATLEIGGAATGVELHATGPIRLHALESGQRGASIVCLRRSITCEDYGRPLGEEERKLMRAIGKQIFDASIMGRLVRFATRDIQDSQRTVLYILLGGQLNAQRVRQLRGLQCQANYVNEILSISERMLQVIGAMVRQPSQGALDEAGMISSECTDSTKTLLEDIRTASTIFALEYRGIVVNACGELQQWAVLLKKDATLKTEWRPLHNQILERRTRWIDLAKTLQESIAEQISLFGLRPEVVKSAESQPDKVESMLQQVMAKLGEDKSSERFERLRSPVVRLINTQVERNRKNVQNWQKVLDAAHEQIATIHALLGTTAASLFAATTRDAVFVSADRFDAQTVILSDPLPASNPLLTASAVVTLSNASGKATYTMNQGIIQRVSSST